MDKYIVALMWSIASAGLAQQGNDSFSNPPKNRGATGKVRADQSAQGIDDFGDARIRQDGSFNENVGAEGSATRRLYLEYYDKSKQKIRVRGEMRGNQKVGEWTYFHENGKIAEQGRYKENKRVGEWRKWDQNGKLLTE